MPSDVQLEAFVRESWKIEGEILGGSAEAMVQKHREFLAMPEVNVIDLVAAAAFFTDGRGRLRRYPGMDVQVGSHRPMPGGPYVLENLEVIVECANNGTLSPYQAHQRYEDLHPFLDGNGRTGRLLWAWMMQRREDPNWWWRGFLHSWYYQSLEAGR